MVGDAYHTELTAVGGTPPYTWTPNPPLPDGLELELLQGGQRAAIHGVPTRDGPAECTITVTDSGNNTEQHKLNLNINPRLAISTPSDLPPAVERRRYLAALDATGGAPPYKWTITDPPAGLRLAADTGAISWSPATSGTVRFAVQAADNAGHTDAGDFTILIERARLRERLFLTTSWLALLALGIPILGGVWITVYAFSTPGSHWSYLGVGMSTALAAFLSGCFVGFLFGIPRVISSGQLRQQGPDEYSPSSNLAEVSDWLTKLLLGAGLVQLTHLAAPISHLIDSVAAGLTVTTATSGPSSAAKVMAGSILFGYATVGILDAYVVTTMWYQAKLQALSS
jgi:Putative Ig domain